MDPKGWGMRDRRTLMADAGDRSEQEPWVSRGSGSGLRKHCRKPFGINEKQCHVLSVSPTVTEPLLVPDASSGSCSPCTARLPGSYSQDMPSMATHQAVCIFHKCELPSLLNEKQGGWVGAFTGSLSSLKEPMLGVSHAVLQGPLCFLSLLRQCSQKVTSGRSRHLFCLVSTKLARAVFLKIKT